MLHNIQTWLQLPEHPVISAAILIFMALISATVVSFLIKWTFVNISENRQKPIMAFIANAIRLPLFISIMLLGTHQALQPLMSSAELQGIVSKSFKSIDILVWGQFLFRSVRFSLQTMSKRAQPGQLIRTQTLPLFENIGAVIIVLIFTYLLFITWQIDMSAWLASAGIIGIAVGFAAKDTIANLLSGVFILADSPYKIGDFIVIDAVDRGMVTHIGLRSTRILTRDDLEINIPNSIIANGKITNESAGRHIQSRIRVAVSVSYDSDIDQVKEVLAKIGADCDMICQDPEPRVRFRQFGASGLNVELLVWIEDPATRGAIIDHLNTQVYKGFHAAGIEIPYSKHDLYIKSLPNQTASAED